MELANENIMDLNEYVIAFNELLEKVTGIFEKFLKKTNKEKMNDLQFQLKYNELVNEILETTKEIAKYLRRHHILEIEYYDFMEIESIIERIITNETLLTESNFKLIRNLLKIFKKITEVKFQILKESLKNHDSLMTDIPKDLMEKYEREYEKFECDMFDFQVEFYTQLEVDDKIDIQPFFEEFRHELEG